MLAAQDHATLMAEWCFDSPRSPRESAQLRICASVVGRQLVLDCMRPSHHQPWSAKSKKTDDQLLYSTGALQHYQVLSCSPSATNTCF